MNDQLLKTFYFLRTHPFSPTSDGAGVPIGYDMFASPLNPRVDPRSLSYYFDVYDWQRFEVVAGLKPLLEAAHRDLGGTDFLKITANPLLLIISGFDNTGRESLLNLLMHLLGKQNAEIVPFEVELADVAHEGNVLTVAQYFLFSYGLAPPAPPQSELAQLFETMTKTPIVGTDTVYHNLFQIWKARISPRSKAIFTLVLRGKVNRDSWRVIYNSTSSLFPITFVLTHQEDYAVACFNALRREGRNAVLIKSRFLDKANAYSYLQSRLDCEREAQSPLVGLTPFTQEAMEALYEKGSRAAPGTAVSFPVGLVTKTFRRALDDKLAQLASIPAASLHNGDEQLLIRGAEIRAARNVLNFGG